VASSDRSTTIKHGGIATFVLSVMVAVSATAGTDTIPVADAPLHSTYYADGSCLLTIDQFVQSGKTVIDADVDEQGSRMLIHCDTDDGKRLTLLARGDSLNVAQRVKLLTHEQIAEGEFGMIAWLTRSGVHYADDSAPRRYVIAGSVKMNNSPPVDVAGMALNNQVQAFAMVQGVLEPILKSDSKASNVTTLIPEDSSPAKTIR